MPRLVGTKKIILLVLLIVAALLAMHLTPIGRAKLTPLEAGLKDSLAPLQKGMMKVGNFTQGLSSVFFIGQIQRENKSLQQEVDKLNGQVHQLNEYKIENENLKKLLAFRDTNAGSFNSVAAEVIGRDSGNWFGTIIIDRGSADGIAKDMPVVTPAGLVGRVIAVSHLTAQVLLLTDPRSGVGCLVQDSRQPGVLEGTASSAGLTRLNQLPKDTPLKKGQAIVTSGLGGIFPKGIPVGQVSSVQNESTGLFKIATVRPYVDLNRLEEVLVITKALQSELNLSSGG